MNISEGLNHLVEKSKTDKATLNLLKNAFVSAGLYEPAAELRAFEKEHFKLTEAQLFEREEGKKFNLALQMTSVKIDDEKLSWKILRACQSFTKLKGKYSIKYAAKIEAEANTIFD